VLTPRWFNHETGETGRDVPAMACALQDVSGAVVGVQCVFLQDGGKRKYARQRPDGTQAKAKLSFGQIVGSAVRLGPVSEHLTVCEGPEDGLTLSQELGGRSVWVTCGTALMPRLALPAEVQRITLAGDNGQAGREAVDAATVAYVDQGIAVDQAFPNAAYKDWNDQLRGIPA
jgi:DNA primase